MKGLFPPILLAAGLPAADAHIVRAMNAFAVESYRSLARNDGNLILSPFNIATALSMVLAGARGQTAEEIQSVLHLQHDGAYDASLRSLLTNLIQAANTGSNELLTANGLWVQQGFAIEPAFEKTLAGAYLAPLTPVDFILDSEGARSRINRWTEAHTKEKIRNLFPPGSLDAQTRLVLASAIYFHGQWEKPFVVSLTQPAPFMRPSGGPSQASFMNQTSQFGYAETLDAQVLEMRYAGTGIAFDILLPKTPEGLRGLEKSLTEENLKAWLGKLARRNVQLSLPKFRAESAFSLENELSAMGMPTAFSDKADFLGISAAGGLAISKVVHKAFVDVSEQGTEAAAATGIGFRALSMREPEQTIVFRADHPFLFLIRDTRSEAVLFTGRLLDPR
jgi:serpin B